MFPHLSAPKRVMLISSRKSTHAHLVNDSSVTFSREKEKKFLSAPMMRFCLIISTRYRGFVRAYHESVLQFAQRLLCFFFLVGPIAVWDLVLLKSMFIETLWATTVFSFLYNENSVQGSTGLTEKWDAFSSTQVSVVRYSGSPELQRRGTDPYVP